MEIISIRFNIIQLQLQVNIPPTSFGFSFNSLPIDYTTNNYGLLIIITKIISMKQLLLI